MTIKNENVRGSVETSSLTVNPETVQDLLEVSDPNHRLNFGKTRQTGHNIAKTTMTIQTSMMGQAD